MHLCLHWSNSVAHTCPYNLSNVEQLIEVGLLGKVPLTLCPRARLLEQNVRFGDPECQCLMLRLRSDLLAVLLAAAEGKLAGHRLDWAPEAALTVRTALAL